MDRKPAAHTAHDELLLARLYGGDLEGRERERALELTASCDRCAAVLADFEAIAAATLALPVPPRPRDFTLTPARAAALRRRRRRLTGLRGIVSSLGPVRSLGASMVAAGVAGILAVGFLSTFGQAGPAGLVFDQAAGPVAPSNAGGYESLASAGSSNKNGAGQTAVVGNPDAGPPSTVPAAASASPDRAVGSPRASGAPSAAPSVPPGEIAADGRHPTGGNMGAGGTPPPSSRSGPDAIPVWLAGLAVLAAVGLVLLTAPSLRRLSHAGRRRR